MNYPEHKENGAQTETEAVQTLPSEALAKGKFYKYAIKVIFGAFVLLTFLFFVLSVDGYRGVNVYRYAAAGHYDDGLDGRWDTSVFIIELFVNMFSDVDLVITPCAFMLFMAAVGACLAIAWLIVQMIKNRKPEVLKAEAGLFAFYVLFAVADIVLICGLKHAYNLPVGAAPVALVILTAVCFALSLVIYVKRNIFFKKYAKAASALNVS